MPDRNTPNIRIEKISLERVGDLHEALIESGREWSAEEMIPKPDMSRDELEAVARNFLELWERDEFYAFDILDASTDQVVGFVFLNHVSRQYQMANLGYMVRTSRTPRPSILRSLPWSSRRPSPRCWLSCGGAAAIEQKGKFSKSRI